ncbi:MAG TPA: GWxTD domain-containing protein, partial [Gemmatimonadaceae bacterium]|nr:GWxTD domain-containing protein [Gemmatimonadaceae bacterium]
DLLQQTTMPLSSDVNGAIEYEKASELFREAYLTSPTNARAFRMVAMTLADSSRWIELQNFAVRHLRAIPWDPQAWLVLGLAQQRQRDTKGAGRSFDSAFVNMDATERAYYDRIERVLNPKDSTRLRNVNDAARDATNRLYWKYADPLWSRGGGNNTHIEFLARVVYAELRWTVDELNARGAGTDRGNVYIRYGPPDITAVLQPKATSEGQDVITYWLYKSGLMFSFSGMSTFGTAQTPLQDRFMAENIQEAQPVRWDNINDMTIDSMPLQVARFRGGKDSVDILVAARPPFARIAAASEVKEPVSSLFWLLKDGTMPVYQDSGVIANADIRTWSKRVAPGTYVYRAEASAPGSTRAARATSYLQANNDPKTGFALAGFGVSDLLVASQADAAVSTSRWSTLHVTPATGPVKSGSQINLVWENYEFGQKEGSAQYAVTLSLIRDQSAAGKIAAKVLGALASVAQIDDKQNDRIVVHLDRSQPYAAAFADAIQIGLGETPPGVYTLTLEIADKVSGQTARRSQQLLIQR